MANADSTIDREALRTARVLLSPRMRREKLWPAVTAAIALTIASFAFAVAMVLAPPVTTEHTVRSAPG